MPDEKVVTAQDLIRWSEALSGIARTGLGFTGSLYERERFEEVLKVAADIRVAAGHELEAEVLLEEWMKIIGSGVPGYVTPKIAVGAVVGNDKGELLLVQRADSGIWLYPTGWADVGYSASEVAVKEVEEETGILADPVRLIGVLDGLRMGFTTIPLYSLVFYCRAIGGELKAHPLETRDVGWFAEDALPTPLAGIDRWGPPPSPPSAASRPRSCSTDRVSRCGGVKNRIRDRSHYRRETGTLEVLARGLRSPWMGGDGA